MRKTWFIPTYHCWQLILCALCFPGSSLSSLYVSRQQEFFKSLTFWYQRHPTLKIARYIPRCQLICQIQMLSHQKRTRKTNKPYCRCWLVSIWGVVHCRRSCVMSLCTPTVCYSGRVYSEQSFSTVFLAAVLTHCDGLLPVASYPVLHVPSAHQGVHSQQWERSACSSFFPYLLPTLSVFLACKHTQSPHVEF